MVVEEKRGKSIYSVSPGEIQPPKSPEGGLKKIAVPWIFESPPPGGLPLLKEKHKKQVISNRPSIHRNVPCIFYTKATIAPFSRWFLVHIVSKRVETGILPCVPVDAPGNRTFWHVARAEGATFRPVIPVLSLSFLRFDKHRMSFNSVLSPCPSDIPLAKGDFTRCISVL